ncbi:uncharacterized protein [Asterias amurensis]|uniref:uncharacterized protein n=1 Tax=Asterias amurensis TaxID=7602 RepID=UPI003AB1F0B1
MATASKKEGISDVFIEDIRSCWKVPAIAHFCSLFRSTFSLPDFEIEELEEALFLDAGVEQSDFIINLVVQLLCGIHGRKDISSENYLKWLRCVMKKRWELGENRVNPLNSEDVTFKVLPTLTKVEILHALCDYRLDANDVSVLKDYEGDNLRVEPLGTDRSGATYWYFYGTRLYKEDREPTQEERDVKRKQKLKEKRKRRRERLRAVKKMKDMRKKQKQKERGKKCKGKKKKKKVSKTSDEESNSESMNSKQQLDTQSNNKKKGLKKEPVKRTASSPVKSRTTNKLSKVTKSKKQVDTGVRQGKSKTNDKSSNETRRKESPQKAVSRKKKESSVNIPKQKTQSKKRCLEDGKSNGKGVIKSKNKTVKEASSSTTKSGNKDSKVKSLQNSASKTRKRKVIKSKAIISESDKSDDEDQPLKKVAKSKTSHKDIKATLNQQKSNKKDSQSASKTDQRKGTHTKGKSNNNKSEDGQQANAKKERKQKKLPVSVSTQEEVKPMSSEDDISSVLSTIESTDSDSEDELESPRWHLVCHSQEDWQQLTDFFKKSKLKCEKELYKTLANDFLPEIQSLFAAKEKALRKKLQELEPRRASSRVVIMQLKREEDERMKSIEEAEQTSMRLQAEEDKREKMKLRNKLQEQSTNSASCPDKPQTKKCKGKAKKTKKMSDSIDMKLQQVFDAVNGHEDSWPFSDPVDEAYAPAYYQIIIKPMCLTLIQKKLNKKDYKTKEEFERDMNQLFTNCLEYNGPGNEYTLMAENLKSCLEYNLEQVFLKQEVDNEDEDSEDETPTLEQYHRPPQRQSARNANTRLEKLEDRVYARLRGLSGSESSILESNNSSEMMSDEEEGLQPDTKEIKSSDDQEEIVKDEPEEEVSDHPDIDSKTSSPLSISDHHSFDSNDNKAYEACSSKSEDGNSDNDVDVHTSDGESATPNQLSTSRLGQHRDIWASKPVGVIAFAPGVPTQDVLQPVDTEDTKKDLTPPSKTQEPVHSHTQALGSSATEVERKETPGQYLNTQSQGPSAISKVNRVKPIQNVSPYVPDTQSVKTKQLLTPPSRDQYQRTQPMAQGVQPMIDLSLNRPDVLKPLTPATNETPKHSDMSFHQQNTVSVNSGLNHVLPQGNLYGPSSLNQDSDDKHSKQFSYSGSSIKPKRSQPMSAPELPAPLTVLPDRHVKHEPSMRVPAVQPLLPSSNYTMQATHHEQVANIRSNTFQQSGVIADYKPNNAAEPMCHDPSQKLWHPLGSEDKMTSATYDKTHQSSPHTLPKSNPLYPHQMKLAPSAPNQPLHSSSSGNILESLLHKQSHASGYQHSGDITNHPKLPSTSPMYMENKSRDNMASQEQQFTSKHPMQPKLVPHDNVGYQGSHGSHGQSQPLKQQTDYGSPQSFAYSKQNLPSQTNCVKTYMTTANTHTQPGNVKLYHNPINVTTNPSQSIARQPDKSLREVAKQQKVASSPLYPHTSSVQSVPVNQTGYENVGAYLSKPRTADPMLTSRTNSLSMLSNEPRNMKEYMDLERANQAQSLNELNKGYLPSGFNQGHTSSLYTDHLRMHASQAAAASYGYPAASRLMLPSRQMTSNQSSSAFTPHDPYSRQSAFRMQMQMQRPSHPFYPQYMQEADQLARQQYQQHMHQRAAGLGAGALYQTPPPPTRTHPDMAFYAQHGIGNAVLSSQPSSSVGAPLPHDPALLSRSSHMSGYK